VDVDFNYKGSLVILIVIVKKLRF